MAGHKNQARLNTKNQWKILINNETTSNPAKVADYFFVTKSQWKILIKNETTSNPAKIEDNFDYFFVTIAEKTLLANSINTACIPRRDRKGYQLNEPKNIYRL